MREFSKTLHDFRVAAGHSMSHVARTLGISVVYYSAVEGGLKPPFPSDADRPFYAVLAQLYGPEAGAELRQIAAATRGAVPIVLGNEASEEAVQVALMAAREIPQMSPSRLMALKSFFGLLDGGDE